VDQGGKPKPDGASVRAASQSVEGAHLVGMIRQDLIAERIVIETHRNMVRYFGDKDPTTRVMLERVLAQQQEHVSQGQARKNARSDDWASEESVIA